MFFPHQGFPRWMHDPQTSQDFLLFIFWATWEACRSSWARNWTGAATVKTARSLIFWTTRELHGFPSFLKLNNIHLRACGHGRACTGSYTFLIHCKFLKCFYPKYITIHAVLIHHSYIGSLMIWGWLVPQAKRSILMFNLVYVAGGDRGAGGAGDVLSF